jgi:hypothetical protein
MPMQNAQFDISRLYNDCMSRGWEWIVVGASPWRLWNDAQWEGFKQPSGANRITREIIQFFTSIGWCLEVGDNEIIYVAPLIYLDSLEFLYHLTPYTNLKSILKNGLLTGEEAGRCTSTRKYCRNSIYVCTSKEKAIAWTAETLIGKSGYTDWALLRIDSRALTGPIYRDPASQTGYVLEDKRVPHPEFIERI